MPARSEFDGSRFWHDPVRPPGTHPSDLTNLVVYYEQTKELLESGGPATNLFEATPEAVAYNKRSAWPCSRSPLN